MSEITVGTWNKFVNFQGFDRKDLYVREREEET